MAITFMNTDIIKVKKKPTNIENHKNPPLSY